jgi:hypothetical protein
MATVPSRWSVAPWRFSLINIKMIEINCNTGTPNEMTYPNVCKNAVPASNLAALGGAKFNCHHPHAHSGRPARQRDNAVDKADGKEDCKEDEKADPKRKQAKRDRYGRDDKRINPPRQ